MTQPKNQEPSEPARLAVLEMLLKLFDGIRSGKPIPDDPWENTRPMAWRPGDEE